MLALVLFLLAFPLLVFFLNNIQKPKYNKTVPLLPGPPGLPLIGNLHQLDNSAPHRYLWQLSKTYGPLMILKLGFKTTLVVSSAKIAKKVLKTHDLEFASRPSFVSHQKLSYNGLDIAFAPYNDYWREMRKICVLHLFNSKRAQSFGSIREDEVCRMIERITVDASESKLINLSEVSLSLTGEIICRIAFGKSFGDGRSKFHGLLNEAQAVMGSFFFSDYLPLMGWIDKLSGMSNRLEKIFEELDLFYQEIIDDHTGEKREKSEQEDITDVCLRLRKDESFRFDLTLDHIKAVLMNIFIAGTDTSAASMVWAMTGLMKNPRVKEKVQEEVRSKMGKKRFVDENDLQKLPYLKAVVKEALRLHPPVPLLVPRETTQKCSIDGYEINPKTIVYVNAWAIGRDPESWECPEEFFPERFLDSSIDFNGQHFGFIPFGAGRRGCPGTDLGVVVVELALANLIYSFDWDLPAGVTKEDIDMDEKPGITTHKKNALCLLARKWMSR